MIDELYLIESADRLVELWQQLEDWAIMDICERLLAAELDASAVRIPGTAAYRLWLLKEAGMHTEELVKRIAQITEKSEEEVYSLLEETSTKVLENDKNIYEQHDKQPDTDIKSEKNSSVRQVMESDIRRTNGEVSNLTKTTVNTSSSKLVTALDKAYFEVTTGMRSYNEVIPEIIEQVADEGMTVSYTSGRRERLDVVVRRAIRTGVAQCAADISLKNAIEMGAEHVIVSSHLGARTGIGIGNHAGWQGKIYSIKKLIDKDKKHDIIIDEGQFGKKIGKHAKDYSMNPSSREDRDRMRDIINDVFYNKSEIRTGSWRGYKEEVKFYIKGEDVVVTTQDNTFITLLKGGINNARVKNGRKQ